MAVRMRTILARRWVDVRVCHLLLLFVMGFLAILVTSRVSILAVLSQRGYFFSPSSLGLGICASFVLQNA